jgi:hypothetical protein
LKYFQTRFDQKINIPCRTPQTVGRRRAAVEFSSVFLPFVNIFGKLDFCKVQVVTRDLHVNNVPA